MASMAINEKRAAATRTLIDKLGGLPKDRAFTPAEREDAALQSLLDRAPTMSWQEARKIQLEVERDVEKMRINSGSPRRHQQESAFVLNERRVREGLPKLTREDALAEIARLKALRGLG